MIELKNVSKKFSNEYVLKDIDLSLPQYGIVVIYGPSGCGKSTLLNIISSLYQADKGDISFNGRHYGVMNEDAKDQLRNSKIGFVFQDYKLFDFESVKNNLMLTIDIKCSDTRREKERRVHDLLKIVGLAHKENEMVSNLSGGEKQRIAIARAICNSPSVLLADEPTGNLDVKNSELVMSILEKIAKESLVVIVSHDEKLTKKYADQIVYMKDGQIERVEYTNHNKHIDLLPLIHIKPRENKARLPLSFCLSHAFNSIKRRKWRTMMILLTTSLGLIGVGLGTVLSNIVSTNLYKSYSSIIDTNKVVMRQKERNQSAIRISALEYDEVKYLQSKYKESISHLGVYYWNNFDAMFSYYDLALSNDNVNKTLPEYTIRHFNEYEFLSNCKSTIYPTQITEIEEDEVVLGLTYPLLNEICYQLYIQRTVNSFSTYLRSNDLYVTVSLENYSWGYSNEFSLKIKGFTMTNRNCFYHSDDRWNEYLFEQRCNLSVSNLINTTSKNPWDLKKSYFFEFRKNRDLFLEDMRFQKENRHVAAEILNANYCPILCKDLSTEECGRVALLTTNNQNIIEGYLTEFFKKSSKHVNACIFGSSSAYVIYPESLMMGFARTTYLSRDINAIDEVIDLTAYIKYEESHNVNISDNVIEGHFTKTANAGLTFNPSYILKYGSEPQNYNEIVISQQIADKFDYSSPINASIYLSFPTKEELLPNGYLVRDFQTVGLKIVGVSDSNKNEISHKEAWSTMFFQTMIGVSRFNLDIDSVALDIDENTEDQVMNVLSRSFPNYEITSPMSSVKESVNKICGYIEKILLVLSISSVIIASLLLSICNYLHFVEIKKDIGLVRCIGIGKNEANKFIFVHSFLMSLFAFILASIQLIIVCFFLSKTMSSMLYIETTFIFNPLSILYMIALALVISLLSSLVIRRAVNKLDPLDCLR